MRLPVVDDRSTDDTAAVMCAFTNAKAGHSPETSYFVQQQKGPSAARNRGIAETHGDWIAFLDSDCSRRVQVVKPLPPLNLINFYVASDRYGFVEIGHLIVCHAIPDFLCGLRFYGMLPAASTTA
jgi:glycosyltransferase involved in cell wall biosynthesis